jgi:DNA repair exonuclease SbcCD nuclease subunit
VKFAHTADWHLGFRQFDRTTGGGINAREADVALALRRLVDDLVAQQPDVVLVGGDVFHHVRPTNGAILTLFDHLTRLRQELPHAAIVMAAGNHDTPRSTETGCILQLVERLGVHLAMFEPKVIPLPGVTVTAVPSDAATQIVKPDPAAELNVLVIHGDVPGYGAPAPADAVDPDELERMGWDYVALGHYHVAAQVGRQMWYSGSLEYASTNPWGEIQKQNELGVDGKGYLLVEPPCPPVFRPIGPTRRFVDLAPIEGTDKSAVELEAEIASRMAETAIDGEVIRLVVREVRRAVKKDLARTRIREWQGRALHFQLELRTSECEMSTPSTRAALHKRLDETVESYLRGRPLAAEIAGNREQFVGLGLEYLKEAALKEDPYTGEQLQL